MRSQQEIESRLAEIFERLKPKLVPTVSCGLTRHIVIELHFLKGGVPQITVQTKETV